MFVLQLYYIYYLIDKVSHLFMFYFIMNISSSISLPSIEKLTFSCVLTVL